MPGHSNDRVCHLAAASLDEVECDHIGRVLAASATLEEAADTPGINVTTLWRKRGRYGIE